MENRNSKYLQNNNVFYKCYKNDIPYSCNGYGLKNDLYNLNNSKNNNFSVSCPKSWIKTPYSGWMVTVPTKLVSERGDQVHAHIQ